MELSPLKIVRPAWRMPSDPVCGRSVPPVPIPYYAEHAEQDYYFCSVRCQEKFVANPERYAAGAR